MVTDLLTRDGNSNSCTVGHAEVAVLLVESVQLWYSPTVLTPVQGLLVSFTLSLCSWQCDAILGLLGTSQAHPSACGNTSTAWLQLPVTILEREIITHGPSRQF